MTTMIHVKVKDQHNHIHDVQALLRKAPENSQAEDLALFQRIEHIVVEGEIILPSIELLFESRSTDNIYRLVE